MATAADEAAPPKITLYTSHRCPWAHRVHIVLKELNLAYEEVLIDLGRPREEWYLKINPRGLVPSMRFRHDAIDEILTESGIVAQFLADYFPSHLLPASRESPEAPLVRARISFFADAFGSKVQPRLMDALKAQDEVKEEVAERAFAVIAKEIEPLLADAKPFFGGNERMTMAEVLTAPTILRTYAYGRAGLIHRSILDKFDGLPNFSKWAHTVSQQESLTYIWNEEDDISGIKAKLSSLRAAQ